MLASGGRPLLAPPDPNLPACKEIRYVRDTDRAADARILYL